MNPNQQNSTADLNYFSSSPAEALFEKLGTSAKGLTDAVAKERLKEYGLNEPAKKMKRTVLWQFFSKFLNPLVIVLIIIGGFSLFFGEKIEAFLVLLMILMSVLLSFVQEYRSGKEAEKLSEMVRTTCAVIRGGRQKEIPIKEIVPGDIVDLYAGDMIPAARAMEIGLINRAVPFAELEATVRRTAEQLASIPSSQLAAMKLVVNQAYENMGLATTQMIATLFDGITRHTPEGLAFKARAEEAGWKTAVSERDSGEPSRGSP